MPSSFTSRLKLERQASGENSGTWGNLVNYVLNRVDASVSGYQAVNVAGSANVTLVSNNSTGNTDNAATDDQVHNAVLEFTGALGASIHVFTDAVEQNYAIFNNTSGSYNLTFGNTGHAANGVVIKQGTKTLVYTDGSSMYDITKDLGDIQVTGLTSNGGATVTGNTDITGNVALKTQGAMVFEDSSGGQFAALKANGTTTSYTLTLPPATGSADQVIKTDGSGNLSFTDMGGGGAVSWQTGSIKTSTFVATAGEGYFCNTTGGAFTVTLPSGPSAGDIVAIKDYAGTFVDNNITVGRNSSNIDGVAQDGNLNENNLAVTFIYIDGTQGWKAINSDAGTYGPGFIQATGGDVTICGDFKIHTFNSPGVFNVQRAGNPSGTTNVDYMVIAGGGNGGPNSQAGGGGAGGFRESHSTAVSGSYTASPLATPTGVTVSAQAYPIVIGAGASGPAVQRTGYSGTPSSALGITSAGGGGGGVSGGGGASGGSGGGGGENASGGAGNTPPVSPAQGNSGGNSSHPSGAGGGGAGAAGSNTGGQNGGNGGSGVTTEITGSPTAYAGGGGGGGYSPSGQGGSGGSGGGGEGGDYNNATQSGFSGAINTGGGGGGNGWPTPDRGGLGGSGKVVIRYKYR